MTVEEILNLKIPCFSCDYGHSCKYYNNALWDEYIFKHPEDGCPAMKYSFESIYFAIIKKKQNEKIKKL